MAVLYLVALVAGSATVFFDVAYQSYLPVLVEREHLIEGNGKLEVTRSASQVAGPGMAGVLVGLLTAPVAVLLDAVSFLVSAGMLLLIRKPEPAPELRPEGRQGMRAEIAEGLQVILRNPLLRGSRPAPRPRTSSPRSASRRSSSSPSTISTSATPRSA